MSNRKSLAIIEVSGSAAAPDGATAVLQEEVDMEDTQPAVHAVFSDATASQQEQRRYQITAEDEDEDDELFPRRSRRTSSRQHPSLQVTASSVEPEEEAEDEHDADFATADFGAEGASSRRSDGAQMELQDMKWDRSALDQMRAISRETESQRVEREAALEEEELRPTRDGRQQLAAGRRGTTLGSSNAYYARIALFAVAVLAADRLAIYLTGETVDSTTELGKTFPSTALAATLVYIGLRIAAHRYPESTQSTLKMATPGMEFLATWRPLFYFGCLSSLSSLPKPDVGTVAAAIACRLLSLLVA